MDVDHRDRAVPTPTWHSGPRCAPEPHRCVVEAAIEAHRRAQTGADVDHRDRAVPIPTLRSGHRHATQPGRRVVKAALAAHRRVRTGADAGRRDLAARRCAAQARQDAAAKAIEAHRQAVGADVDQAGRAAPARTSTHRTVSATYPAVSDRQARGLGRGGAAAHCDCPRARFSAPAGRRHSVQAVPDRHRSPVRWCPSDASVTVGADARRREQDGAACAARHRHPHHRTRHAGAAAPE